MDILGIKRLSCASVVASVVLLVVLVAGAMFFADKLDDLIDGRKPKATQTMEMRGSWLGMKMAAVDSPTAQRLGIPPSTKGVVIVELDEKNGWRARQAGAMEGDLIVAIDGQNIRDLADVYELSRNVDVGGVVLMDVRRWGQLITLVMPALQASPAVAAPWQPGQAVPAQPAAPLVASIAAQPVAWPAPVAPGPQFCCPIHNRTWSQNEVHPMYRCPLCNCPLNRVR
jgi:predicted metalloprotease with PDZ domain